MLGFAVVVVVVVGGGEGRWGITHFGPGSHSIYITIGPVLKCLTLSLPTTRGSCVQTENVVALGAAADEVLGGKRSGPRAMVE